MAFQGRLFRWSGPSAWVFVEIPADEAPPVAGSFGRTPVVATVDGRTWATSAWRDKSGTWLLPLPARIRAGKDDGELVAVSVELDTTRL